MSTQAAETPSSVLPFHDPSRRRRLVKVVTWLVGIAVVIVLLNLLGVDVIGWIQDLWDQIKAIPVGYIVAGLFFQTGVTAFAAVSYYGILRAAYPGEVSFPPILTAYAVGVAMNNFLPANIGTFVTLLMFVAIIPACTFAGAIAAYLVQKIFFTLAGTFVYLYLFLSVPGSFHESLGNVSDNPVVAVAIVAGGAFLLVLLGRIFWKQVKKLWAQAKKGGVILSQPKRYFLRVFLPSFLSWTCKLVVIGIFLAAFAIPVTFESIMWVTGSGSLANVVSVTPGAVGITQATNALALDACCDVANDTAVAYSTAQQLVTTAWNILVALVLVVWVFGWTGGKLLVGQSYTDAKVQGRRAEGAARGEEAGKAGRAGRRGRGPDRPDPPAPLGRRRHRRRRGVDLMAEATVRELRRDLHAVVRLGIVALVAIVVTLISVFRNPRHLGRREGRLGGRDHLLSAPRLARLLHRPPRLVRRRGARERRAPRRRGAPPRPG